MQKQQRLLNDICREQNMKYFLFDRWLKYVYKKHYTVRCSPGYVTWNWVGQHLASSYYCYLLFFRHYLGKTALNVIKSHWTGLMCCCWFVGDILRSRTFTTIKAKKHNAGFSLFCCHSRLHRWYLPKELSLCVYILIKEPVFNHYKADIW